jgi:CBS domain-containing protein
MAQRSRGTSQGPSESGSRLDGGGDGALSGGAPARDLADPRWMGSVSRAETEPGQRKRSAESSERSSLATTPEPRRDRLGSLPTPHPRFPPPSILKIGDLLAAGQTHDAELSLCLIGGAGDQRRRRRPADVTICFAGPSEGSRLPASTPVWDLTEMIGMKAAQAADSAWWGALTTVRDIMSTELVTVEPSANLTEAVHAMSAGRSGSVLVLQAGSLVGIFTERDILRALAHSAKADLARISSVTQWMSRDPATIGPDTTVAEALNQMLFGGFRHLPVMDQDAVVGMVSMRDLAKE